MSTTQKILFFFILPMIAPILYPPSTLAGGWIAIILDILLFGMMGFLLIRGRFLALTLCIFLLGLNAIIRIMMLASHAAFSDGSLNLPYIIAAVLSIVLSIYLVLRLDRVDVRSQMAE